MAAALGGHMAPAQRNAFACAGVPQPRFSLIEGNHQDPVLEFPVVVKPADSQGQRGIQRVDDPSTLNKAIEEARRWSRKGLVVVEEFEPGPEVTANVWVENGRIGHWVRVDRIAYAD